MAEFAYLLWTPLPTAGVWFALSAYLLYEERYRTWTEVFFVGLCLATGGYALADAIFFANLAANLWLEASASLACLTLASTFLLLYGLTLHGRLRLPMLLAFVPSVAFIVLFPSRMFLGFAALPGDGPSVPVYDQAMYSAWLSLVAVLWVGGLVQITRTFLEVRRQNRVLARRISIILLGFVAALSVGTLSNGFLGLDLYTSQPPLFSTLLVVPGVLIFLAMTPNAYRRLNDAILRRKAALSDVKAAFLVFSDGTVIGSKVQPEEKMIDPDAFSATLDVISNFMRTSFPTLRGKWLKSIRHGDYTLVLERGQEVYLTLVLSGAENDQLRRKMIEALDAFERENSTVLSHWRGVANDARGVDDVLASMLAA